ncbi:MAG TPA: cytochrome C551 [candidate division Zixibacteria bacterium]|nr:cytochrome C551 [candidate division Zixibacteria bacterium]
MEEERLKDKILICVDCDEEFVFTVAAQEYFLEQGITEEPKRCKSCYMQLKKGKRLQQKENRKRGSYNRHNGNSNGNYRHYYSRDYKK